MIEYPTQCIAQVQQLSLQSNVEQKQTKHAARQSVIKQLQNTIKRNTTEKASAAYTYKTNSVL